MKLKTIKLLAVAAVFAFLAIILSSSQSFSSKAKGNDVLTEIANYKTWTKITKKPIKVELLTPGVLIPGDADFTNGIGISANG